MAVGSCVKIDQLVNSIFKALIQARENINTLVPSIHLLTILVPYRVVALLEPIQATEGCRRGTSWTVYKPITGHQR